MLGIENYKALAQPPKEALKTITGGRLNGKTDINPQWRYEAMTKQYGLCGIGWKYTIDRVWTEPAPDEQVFAWVQISLYIKVGESWSEAIPGLGGNFLVEKERSSLHANDEGFKMAETDALGTAMKKIGVAADVYAGRWDGSKYQDNGEGQGAKNDADQFYDDVPWGDEEIEQKRKEKEEQNKLNARAKQLCDELGKSKEVRIGLWRSCDGNIKKVVEELEEEKAAKEKGI